MQIGIDFDNTIACYDGVFHAAAIERGLIAQEIRTDKTSVRDFLRQAGREEDWTKLQGYVYGARMGLVDCYDGVKDFIARAVQVGHGVYIVSHKTQTPFLGPKYDLHQAARKFLVDRGIVGAAKGQLPDTQVYFELTLAEKLARIAMLDCTVFIDDLPEFLGEEKFPATTRPVLFSPGDHYPGGKWNGRKFECFKSWADITAAFLEPLS
jgi:hypothetical protein